MTVFKTLKIMLTSIRKGELPIVSELMRENLRKLINLVRRFSKELIVALVLAVIAAVAIEILNEYERGKTIKNNL